MVGMTVYKKCTDPNKELAKNITEAIMKEFKNKLDEGFKGISTFGETFNDKLNLTIGGYIAKLNDIANLLENPHEKEVEIENINKQLKELESYLLEIDKLK